MGGGQWFLFRYLSRLALSASCGLGGFKILLFNVCIGLLYLFKKIMQMVFIVHFGNMGKNEMFMMIGVLYGWGLVVSPFYGHD